MDSVDYFLIHQPDTGGVPLEETLRAADELHRAGIFKRFVRRCPPTPVACPLSSAAPPSLATIFSHWPSLLLRVQGVSNFPAYGVMQVYYKCKELGYVLPSVYEGAPISPTESHVSCAERLRETPSPAAQVSTTAC